MDDWGRTLNSGEGVTHADLVRRGGLSAHERSQWLLGRHSSRDQHAWTLLEPTSVAVHEPCKWVKPATELARWCWA
jgi:hypothetical protein